MKQSLALLLTLLCSTTIAQPDTISITTNKTTSIVFPLTIQSVDRGIKDLLVQKVKGAENVLQVKAGKDFPATNMTVITADGKVYSFIVYNTDGPSVINITTTGSVFEKVAGSKPFIRKKYRAYGINLRLAGIYIEKDILYFRLELANHTNISYDIDMLRFFIKDKKQSKRTASQELEQLPQQVHGNTAFIPAGSKQTIIAALSKFTIPDKKILTVRVTEKNGGRNVKLRIRNRNIIKAKTI